VARALVLLIEQWEAKLPGLIWSLVHIRKLGGCLKAMERMNASFRSGGYLLNIKQLILMDVLDMRYTYLGS
jgi:hypothetical protein